MSAGSLFDSENNQSSNKKAFLIGFVLLVIIAAAALTIYWKNQPVLKTKAEKADESIRNSTVMMLAQPMFSGEDFREQILGKARLERLNLKTRDVYFSLPELNQAEQEEILNRFIADKAKIDSAKEVGGKMVVGDYSLPKSSQQSFFFKTPLENIKVDSTLMLKFPFQRASGNRPFRA